MKIILEVHGLLKLFWIYDNTYIVVVCIVRHILVLIL